MNLYLHRYAVSFSRNITRGSLLKLVQTYGNFPESLCAICIYQTLEALAYVHSKGLRHDNVRCNNLMITNLGVVKLSGFGNIRQEDMNKDAGVQLEPFWSTLCLFFLLLILYVSGS
jgi:serine/threonine protein kinase